MLTSRSSCVMFVFPNPKSTKRHPTSDSYQACRCCALSRISYPEAASSVRALVLSVLRIRCFLSLWPPVRIAGWHCTCLPTREHDPCSLSEQTLQSTQSLCNRSHIAHICKNFYNTKTNPPKRKRCHPDIEQRRSTNNALSTILQCLKRLSSAHVICKNFYNTKTNPPKRKRCHPDIEQRRSTNNALSTILQCLKRLSSAHVDAAHATYPRHRYRDGRPVMQSCMAGRPSRYRAHHGETSSIGVSRLCTSGRDM